ncbi:MAG TPA: hypothetical protein VMX12_07505 [Acidimicrobiia bacterium]|nr:hypothetical protein [Acidimicrobiia bacterium]
MSHIKIYLAGWRDGRLYTDAVNHDDHPLHAAAYEVHLNMFMRYAPGGALYLAAEYEANEADDLVIAEKAFERFNVGSDEIARKYRDDGHRSLSVGDVVVIDGRAYAVASFGFDLIEGFDPGVEFKAEVPA